jgi:hypothetical protein
MRSVDLMFQLLFQAQIAQMLTHILLGFKNKIRFCIYTAQTGLSTLKLSDSSSDYLYNFHQHRKPSRWSYLLDSDPIKEDITFNLKTYWLG